MKKYPLSGHKTALTPRETEVIGWISGGKTNADIGRIFEISPRTVQKHLENIYQKLGVENRTAAAARAYDIASTAYRELLNQSILTYLILLGSTGLK